jgi:hypothetical protein
MNHLRDSLAQYWLNIQGSLFPWLKEELGELTEKQQRLVATLELVRVEEFLRSTYGLLGRPPEDRTVLPAPLCPRWFSRCRPPVC